MGDTSKRHGQLRLRLAQLLLVAAAGGLWAAARLPWVVIRSFDGLGQPKRVTVSGASWSTALLPLAVLALAAAIAAVAVRGWPLRVLAVLLAAASFAAGYLAISLWVVDDVAARGAGIAAVPIISLLGADRHYAGAMATLAAAVCILVGAALLMRSASSAGVTAARYVTPEVRREATRRGDTGRQASAMSERMIWDALDEGADPTDVSTGGRADRISGTDAFGPDDEGR